MSHVLGIDYDVRAKNGAIHCVLVDEDTGRADYYPLPIPGDSFEALCRVRVAFKDAPFELRRALYETVVVAAVEEPYSQNRQTLATLSTIKGAVVACLPTTRIHVVSLTAQQWKRATVGKSNASKDDVREWAAAEMLTPGTWDAPCFAGWPQDAFDSYALARAVAGLGRLDGKQAA